MACMLFLALLMVTCIIQGTVCKQHDVDKALTGQLFRLNTKFESFEENCRSEIDKLRDETKAREVEFVLILNNLSKQIASLKEKNEILESDNRRVLNILYDKLGEELLHDAAEETELQNIHTDKTSKMAGKAASIKTSKPSSTLRDNTRHRRALVDGYNIAFTAYMDHDTDNLGINQTLVYNKILLNDGGAYNVHSGIFTAPMAGVYSFSFFVGQRNTHEVRAGLWQNSVGKLDAVSQTVHTTQDGQGGNTANLKLEKGDIVYVKHTGGDNHIEGSRTLRLTSFSGFILYPVEDVSILGK